MLTETRCGAATGYGIAPVDEETGAGVLEGAHLLPPFLPLPPCEGRAEGASTRPISLTEP